MQHLLSTSLFSGFGRLVSSLGGDPNQFLQRFGLPKNIESGADDYVPFIDAAMLFEYCAEELHCPDFGLQLSQGQGLSVLGPVAVLARNTPNVEAAVRSISDYLHLITPAMAVSFELKPSDKLIRASFTLLEPGLFQSRQLYELYIGNGQLIVQMLIGAEVSAQRIYFPHSRISPAQVYQKLFRCEVEFNQEWCAADISIDIMQRKLAHADRETARIASAYLTQRYGGQSTQLSEQVNHLVTRLLPTGYCKIAVIAEQLGIHPRTLQRHLGEEGVIFEQLVDAQRRVLARRYLTESTLQLSQVAGLLGYNDQSALNRSCQRWFQCTPRQIRTHPPSAK